ncbi:head-tail joining protein [Methylobacterium sp. WCS2018Hpa-22]|uniref:head-tail joining protein n=1 Tax=Methylobacterium sp. WCS2018Hpa-22 TaxID=3073633 RepID=UPI00288AD17E|nr:head-tail joining protein [Methylobacterium sp. WCS2018Hpa-22]
MTDADLMLFLDPRDFGIEAEYFARDGNAQPKTVLGIFDAEATNFNPNRWPGHDYQLQTGAHFTSTGPTFLCRSSDLVKGGRQRDRLKIEGVRYRVQESKPDGTGMVVLVLMEDDAEGA